MWQGIKNIYHLFMALLANLWYGFPSRKLTVIGVTGTDGKTTTVHLIYHILKSAGKKVSMISSIGAVIPSISPSTMSSGPNGSGQVVHHDIGFHVTTPSPFSLQRFIKKVYDASDFLVLEVTSHALDQHRVWGVDFDVAVLTNVTHEHLDYHKTYEKYVKVKTRLLMMAKVAVVNKDDESYKLLNSKFEIRNSKFITYGVGSNADLNPKNFPFKTNLIGEFNRYNILAAIAVCRALGIEDDTIRKAVKNFELPVGRMEVVHEDEFTVMIDFAHTPNALSKILTTVRPSVKGRLIHVFGSAGERDCQKRPQMGKTSSTYADVIVLTAEDPRSESVEKIMDEIASGIRNGKWQMANGKLFKIPNRQGAIVAAIGMARKGDLVLLTGKGHERSMNYGRGEERWSEHEAVRNALKMTN